MADAIANALTGTFPEYGIDWSKLMISRGKLLLPATSTAVANGTTIQFTWSPAILPRTTERDKAVLVVYCPALRVCYYDMTAFSRSDGAGQLNVDYFAGQEVQVYLGFITEKGDRASVSKYMGAFTL